MAPGSRSRAKLRCSGKIFAHTPGYSGVSAYFSYPCPGCRTTSTLHDPDCRFDGTPRSEIEKAYTDLLAALSVQPLTESALQSAVHGRWSAQHAAALSTLVREQRVRESETGVYELLTATERKERVAEPTQEPLKTIYEEGSVPGCHDHALFAMIAFYEMVGFSWEEIHEHVTNWLRESGAWDRGGFEEDTPGEVVEAKRHVYEQGYGWLQAAQEAKAVIERRNTDSESGRA